MLGGPAYADDSDPTLPTPGWDFWTDRSAAAFIYAPLVVAVGLRLFAKPRSEPLFFSQDEGGAEFDGDTVSDVAVGAYGFAGAAFVALVPGDGRWHHAKGYSQALLSTVALTEMAKNAFGRHRPHYQTGSTEDDDRRSFFSGHSSVTFATTTYVSLYLHRHVFKRWRRPGQAFAAWELAPYAALFGGSALVAASRLADNRHHLSDVLTGTAVGTSLAGFFFWVQERNYSTAKAQLVVTPRQIGLRARF